MKIYQLIYTSVKHCLSDAERGLENAPGLRVYSCSQGLTKEEIEEVQKFSSYRLPANCEEQYSKTPCDPQVPEQFPKSFRTFRVSENKVAALQTVYSGYDFNGNPGNFFAHAFIFEKTGKDFHPEDYYNSPDFKTYLTPEEADRELVRFLPIREEMEKDKLLDQAIYAFVEAHKKKVSFILEKAIDLLRGNGKEHLFIETADQDESDYYLLAIKKLLPDEVCQDIGISTYNLFLPSNRQKKIRLHASVKGKNNITPVSIEKRTNCEFIDVTSLDEALLRTIKLFDFPVDKMNELYEKYSITTLEQMDEWFASYDKVTEPGIGRRLLDIRDKISRELFIARCKSILSVIDSEEMDRVRFELLEVMYENIHIISCDKEDISKKYVYEGVKCIAAGESKNLENLFQGFEDAKKQAAVIYDELDSYMRLINRDDIDSKNGMLILRLFALIKQNCVIETWKAFFRENSDYLRIFVEIAAKVMINDTEPVTFTAPNVWTSQETAEAIAYFEASTEDPAVKRGCRKYILNHSKIDWAQYGIILSKEKKSREDTEADIHRIRKLLSSVGYVPFQKTSYRDLKYDIVNEMNASENPLLLTRLLYAYYMWQASAGQLADAQKTAQDVAELILEMKQTQRSCYQYIFPKLALEILDTPGHYHELMINAQTMEPDFWSWFLLGYKRHAEDEGVMLTYQRVFDASSSQLRSLPIYTRLKRTLHGVQ